MAGAFAWYNIRMSSLFLIFFFTLGAIVGSFLNVVVLRYGAKTVSGRSLCLSCGKTLRWFELVPLVSFLAQRGRCRGCKTRISLQYFLVELITGLVFALIFWKEFSAFSSFSYLSTIYYLLSTFLWCLLITLSVYDFRHKIIPDALVYSAALISFLLFLYSYFPRPTASAGLGILHTSYFIDFWAGFFFAAPFALIWFFSRGRAMGLGDAKLVVFFPWVLGLANGLSALIIGFWIGAAVSVAALALKAATTILPRRFSPALRTQLTALSLQTELPLGPFLVLGLFLVYIFGWDITGLGMLLTS